MTDATMSDEIEDLEEGSGGDSTSAAAEPKSSKLWLDKITEAERIFRTYQDKADSIDKLYANLERLSKTERDREFQLFWANIEVLKPSTYSRPPVPVVVPLFKDRKPLVRTTAELLERCSIVGFKGEQINDVMLGIRDDLVINARGAAWLRYEAASKNGKVAEKVCIDHADRKDFVHDPARNWKEVDWTSKRSWLARSAMRKRFKKTSGDAYKTATYSVRTDDAEADDGKQKAGVWEIWCKSQNKVVWVAEGCEVVLDEGKPHLQLEGFFPCPKPAYATLQRRTLIPVPDAVFYKDQLEEINELTGRIAALSDALRVRGFYPAGAGDIGDAIEAAIKNTSDNQVLVPISNWTALGGSAPKDTIVWLPLDQIATTITQCVTLRKDLMEDVYQITGLSDIMRGQTEASETLGAQKLKSQYGSVRIRDKQAEMVRIALDITQIAAEIMAENFSPATLLEMSQLDIPTDAMIAAQVAPIEKQILVILDQVEKARTDPQLQQQAQQNPQQAQQILGQAKQQVDGLKAQIDKLKQTPTIEAVMKLLRSQRTRAFTLDIETDSTIAPDEDAAKQRATEFVTAVGGFMEKTLPLVASQPQAAELAAELLKFVAGQFRAGRQLEGVIDEFADRMKQVASQPKPPDPELVKAQAKQQQDAEAAKVQNAERMANAEKTTLEAQTNAANAASERKINEQREADASEARRIERMDKSRLTDKQIELLDAKRADEAERHAQEMTKGDLELEKLDREIEHVGIKTEATTAAADAKLSAIEAGTVAGEGSESAPAAPRKPRAQRQPGASTYKRPQDLMTEMLGTFSEMMAQQNAALVTALTAPKTIVTDQQGNPIGVQTVGAQ